MSKYYRIKSPLINIITESIKKLSLLEDDLDFSTPAIDKDGQFFTDVKTKTLPELKNSAQVEELDTDEKDKLIAQAIEKLQKSLDISKDLSDIINKITNQEEIKNDDWVLNKDHCDLYLASKNAHVFKQNDNLCLSHDGKIEIFDSVEELKKYLQDKSYPELPSVKLYESRM